jgi:plastocyanin
MKKKLFVIFMILIGALIVSGCTSTTTTSPTPAPAPVVTTPAPAPVTNINNINNTNNTNNTNTNVETPNPVQNQVTVNIQNFAFNPSSITIPVGSTIRWVNLDNVQHEVRGSGFDSGLMSQNAAFTFTFTQAGTYNYACAIHPSMQGQIIVQ